MRFNRLALLVPLLAACDGSDSVSVKPFNASASDDQIVSALDSNGRTAFCQEVKAYYESEISTAMSKKIGCYSLALAFSGGDASACNQAAQACIADESGDVTAEAGDCDPQKADGCGATVSELEACYTAMIERIKLFGTKISCSVSASEIPDFDSPPAACAPVEAKCPGLIESDTEAE